VEKNGTDQSLHSDQWTLRAGEQSIVTHEYIEVVLFVRFCVDIMET
jgi:hypothetical protein